MYDERPFEVSYKLIRNVIFVALVIMAISLAGKVSAGVVSEAAPYVIEAR